ncbi:hypothetical protein [Micromonospora sp. A202]|uniref:hypothetical protein n=1 Tax=Micromonospora sp. A202 TaxID=2572899 RepID=UPI001151152C|nr:hypothetical protein [Micromonospora sp. A202]
MSQPDCARPPPPTPGCAPAAAAARFETAERGNAAVLGLLAAAEYARAASPAPTAEVYAALTATIR